MRKMKWILLSSVALVFVIAGCGAYGGSYGGGATQPPAPPAPPAPSASGPLSVTASYAKFQPPQIEVAKDKPTKLNLTSSDSGHTFTVDELGINISVAGGKTASQDITPTKSGTFTFYCAVPGHRQAGMEGKITVK